MNPFVQQFLKTCDEKYIPLGFSRYKRSYARICNDVVHVFSLLRSQYVPRYTVGYEACPICGDSSFRYGLETDIHRLEYMLLGECGKDGGWFWDQKLNISIESCLDPMIQGIDSVILPYFEKCVDCRSTLWESIILEEKENVNWLWLCNLSYGNEGRFIPWEQLVLFDWNRFFISLKIKDYPYARVFLTYNISYYTKELEKMKETNCSEEQIERWEEYINKFRNYLENLDAGNYPYFDDLIRARENENLEILKKNYPKMFRQAKIKTN